MIAQSLIIHWPLIQLTEVDLHRVFQKSLQTWVFRGRPQSEGFNLKLNCRYKSNHLAVIYLDVCGAHIAFVERANFKMRFLGLLALTTAFTLPILADEDYEEGVAISPADIPTQCIVLCAPIIQVANGCQAKAAPAKPEEMDDKRRYPHSWMRREDDSEEDEMPMAMTADSCICNNATVNINTAGPVCDSCIRQNGATTKGKKLVLFLQHSQAGRD